MRRSTLVLAVALTSCIANVSASTWNLILVGNQEALHFFDADTVEKSGNTVTLWTKTVQSRKADSDGSWATANRELFDCSARTIQRLSWSSYNNNGDYIGSSHRPSTPYSPAPDTIGEALLRIACEPNFPRDTTGKNYFKPTSNDVFKVRDNIVRRLNSQVDIAPK